MVSKPKTLKEKIEDINNTVRNYGVALCYEIGNDVSKIAGMPLGEDGITYSSEQKGMIKQAITDGRITSQKYLDKVVSEIPEGAYRNFILDRVGETLKREFLIE